MSCIGYLFSSLLYLSHAVYKLSSSPYWNTMISLLLLDVMDGGKICLSMLPQALPMYQLSHKVIIHTMWLQYLSRKRGRGVALSLLHLLQYHFWPHTIQLNCIFHPEESTKVLIRIFSGMASKLILLNYGDQDWFQLKVVSLYIRLSDC